MVIKFNINGILNFDHRSIDKEKIIINDFEIEVMPAYKYNNQLFEFSNNNIEYELKLEEIENPHCDEGWDS